LAAAAKKRGAEIRTSAAAVRITTRTGRAESVIVEDGKEFRARVVLSNADPKRTFLELVDATDLPSDFRDKIRGIKMAGPCAKVNMVLSEEPHFRATPRGPPPIEPPLF